MKSAPSVLAGALVAAVPFPLWAQAVSQPSDLVRLSVDDLLKIEVTSPGKKEQPVEDVAAAIFVITQDDIQRSGCMPGTRRNSSGRDRRSRK